MATKIKAGAGPVQSDAATIDALTEAARVAVENGDTPTAISSFEQLLLIDPKNATLMSNLGVLYFNSDNKERAVELFGNAHAAEPQNNDIRRNYLNALGGAAAEKSNSSGYPQAVKWIRMALALEPDHAGMRINLANLLEFGGLPAQLSDFMPDATPDQIGTHVLVACMPKSGSTFLKATLCALTGWPEANFAYAYLQNEQEIYLPNLLQVARQNNVTQQHCRATGPNTQILQAFGVKPIVLVRNLPDIVLSLSDFYDQGAVSNTFFGDVWPTLDAQGKYNLIIDQVMPWYAGFYASWERAQRLRRLDCFFMTYEEMLADKPAMIGRISDFLELDRTPADCAAAVRAVDGEASKTRFNKGIAGRGERTLDDDQKAHLRRLASAYGPVNLERIGLAE